MPSYLPSPQDFQLQHALAPFLQGEGLPFADVLRDDDVQRIFAKHPVKLGRRPWALWTPATTLWAFLWQMLGKDSSCRQVVSNVMLAFALSRDTDDHNVKTGNYCKARAAVPALLLQELAVHVAQGLEQTAPEHWRWHGRSVCLADGSTSTLPDTADNQRAFPQAKTQKKGLGFPIIRWVVLVSLMTALVQGFQYGPYQGKETGESALLQPLLVYLRRGDILLGDRLFGTYALMASLLGRGVDLVARKHHGRKTDYSQARKLGTNDYLVVWRKPEDRPNWLDAELFALLPDTMPVREIRVLVTEPGYRVKELLVVTTLLDPLEYPAADIAELYSKRWQVELDIRSLKVYLGMDRLSCRSPALVEKEIWARLLTYNLVRKAAAQAAYLAEKHPRSLSFTATKQVLLGEWSQMSATTAADYLTLAKAKLQAIGKEKVGDRPGRCEPRAVKRRPKPHKLLTEPRAKARAKLLKGTGKKTKGKGKQTAGPSRSKR